MGERRVVLEPCEEGFVGGRHLGAKVRDLLVREVVLVDERQHLREARENAELALERAGTEIHVEDCRCTVPPGHPVAVTHGDLVHVGEEGRQEVRHWMRIARILPLRTIAKPCIPPPRLLSLAFRRQLDNAPR
jgi:hypothetical protein